MPYFTHRSAVVFALISPLWATVAHTQTAPAISAQPTLVSHNADLNSAPEPQNGTQQKDQQPAAPSLKDLGLSPDQTRADLDAQHRLDRRSHDLKVHQTLGLITLVPITAACLTSTLAPPDPRGGNNEIGRDIHVALGSASVTLHGATAWYAIRAPCIPGQGPTKGGIKLHKYLVAIHAPGMVLTPILGAMAYNQAANGQKVVRGAQFPVISVRVQMPEADTNQSSFDADLEVAFAGQTAHYSHVRFQQEIEGREHRITAVLPATLTDFKIDPPRFLTVPIHNEIPVKIQTAWHAE